MRATTGTGRATERRLLEKLNQGRFDLALVPGPMWGRIFEGVPVRTLDRCWMASPALGGPRRVLTVEQLSAFPTLSQYPDTIHAQLQSAWFQHNGIGMQHAVQANSFAVVGELVQAGLGIGQLPAAPLARLAKAESDFSARL